MWERRERREQHWLYEAGSLLSLLSHIHSHIALTCQWELFEREKASLHSECCSLLSLLSVPLTYWAICEWMWESKREKRAALTVWGWPSLSQTLVSVLHWDVRAICEWMWERRERREQHWLYEAGLLSLKLLCLFSTEMLEQYVSGWTERRREKRAALTVWGWPSLLKRLVSVLHWDVRAICEWMWERRERREQHWLYEAGLLSLKRLVSVLHSHIELTSQWRTDTRRERESSTHCISAAFSSLSSLSHPLRYCSNIWVRCEREEREESSTDCMRLAFSLSNAFVCSPLRC